MKKFYLLIFLLLIITAAKAQYVQKVTNINYYGVNGLNPRNLTVFNGKLYFFGTDDPQYVDKLMFTPDGSAAGVTVVKQIDTVKQYPSLRHLTILNNLLIFDNYSQLWKSDGTPGGTSSIATIKVSTPNFVVLNNKVYFAGDNTNSSPINDQLMQTDGTAAGTTLVKTINPSGPAHIFNLFTNGGKIYFGADDGVHLGQLWVSDGTAAGTMLLKIISTTATAYPNFFFSFNGKVYFNASDDATGSQLWVTDGTPSGTLRITSVNTSEGLFPSTFTIFNSKLFFMGVDTGAYYQLWSTDGTTAGTVKVKTDYTPRSGYGGFMPNSMAVHKGKLYMAGYDSVSATIQLFVSDGTTAGTTKVTSFPHSLYPAKLYSFQNKLIFTGGDTISNEEELFATDGTAAGTVCPTPPDTWGQYPFYPWEAWVPFNGALYYKAAYTYFADYQLCRYTENPSGIEQQTSGNLSVYPNPTNGRFNVVLPKTTGNAIIEVYNIIGVLIYRQTAVINVNTIDLTDHPVGVYILKVISNNQIISSQKIIKN